MTKGRRRFHLYLMLNKSTAGPSTSLRSGRDDNSYFGKGCWYPRKIVIPTGGIMGLRSTQGDEKHLLSTNRSPWKHRPPLCHPERSRGICGSADHSWECFSTEGLRLKA